MNVCEIAVLLGTDLLGVLASGCMLWLTLSPKGYLGEQAGGNKLCHRQARMRLVFLATVCLCVFILIGVTVAFPKFVFVLTGVPTG